MYYESLTFKEKKDGKLVPVAESSHKYPFVNDEDLAEFLETEAGRTLAKELGSPSDVATALNYGLDLTYRRNDPDNPSNANGKASLKVLEQAAMERIRQFGELNPEQAWPFFSRLQTATGLKGDAKREALGQLVADLDAELKTEDETDE